MRPSRRVTMMSLLLVCAGLAACGGSGEKPSLTRASSVTLVHAITYRSGLPLHVHVADGGREGPLRLEQITYSSADGQRVPALFAIPTASAPLGCLIYQGDAGQTKEQFPEIRQGAAMLRLATFTIDPRNTGARGSPAQVLAAFKQPETLLAMVLDTVVDLRMGLDYLETRPECHHNIAYLGTGFGGQVGVLFAAQDPRINAAVLTSMGATFKEAMLVGSMVGQQNPGFLAEVPGAATNPALLAHSVSILGPYDPAKWVGRIAPRPVMLINGRFDTAVPPIDALELAAAAGDPKTVLYFNGGHNPFAPGPDQQNVTLEVEQFLSDNLGLPMPL